MTTTFKIPTIDYPYLAVYNFGESLTETRLKNLDMKDVVLISLIQDKKGEDLKPYVQYILGGSKGFFTKEENAYVKLPAGFQVTITQ